MLKFIGIIAIFVALALYPEQVKKSIDVGSYVCKVFWVISEGTFRRIENLYAKDIAPQVEKARSVDVSAP